VEKHHIYFKVPSEKDAISLAVDMSMGQELLPAAVLLQHHTC